MPSTDPTDWKDIRIRSQYGSKSPFGAFLYNNKIMIPAMENDKFVGFAAVSGSSLDPEATNLAVSVAGSDLQSDRIEPLIFGVNETYVSNISALVFKNKAYITATVDASTTNNRVFIFDFSISNMKKAQRAAWAPMSGLNAAQFAVFNGRLYYGTSTATGFVYQLETTTYSDEAAAIDSYFWTKEFSGLDGHENLEKDFRQANILVEKAGAYQMAFNWRVDSDNGEGLQKLIDLDPGGSTWNAFVWGQDNWDAGVGQQDVRVFLGPARGKRIQFKFANLEALAQRCKVHWMTFTYNLKGKR